MQFFEMQRDDALRALDLFKRAINQVNFLLSTVRQIIICSILLIFKYLIYLLPQKFCIEWLHNMSAFPKIVPFLFGQAGQLSEFYEMCKTIHIGRGERFLKIELVWLELPLLLLCFYFYYDFNLWYPIGRIQPLTSFLQAMEEHVRDAPLASINQRNQVWNY